MNALNCSKYDNWKNYQEVYEELINYSAKFSEKLIVLSSYPHKCPRCKVVTKISSQHPYCLECNCDSLH